ncbi:MAG: serine/threonine protein kinase, partial [Myxococcales bacterium]|nr:serine/threonine protein kinase [Myxococcales bacterium]
MSDPRPDSTTFDWTDEGELPPRVRAAPGAIGPGEVVGGFRILGRIGEGGMGTVWEAEQDHPRRRVALKTIAATNVSRGAARRFRFEAEALGTVLHWGIPQVYAAGDDQGRLYIAMERVVGTPLDEWAPLADRKSRVRMLAAICDAVHHAHLRGIVHRDLKPANVLVTADGRPKVVDFGIATELGGADGNQIVGTPAYISPEQISGGAVDVRTDVWSLGVMAYELLCGTLPVTVEGRSAIQVVWALQSERVLSLGERDPSLRGDLEAIVGKALERERDRRYPSADALGTDLRRWLAYEPVEARTPTWSYLAVRWMQRHALVALAAVAVFGALGTGQYVAFDAWRVAEAARATEAEQRQIAEEALHRADGERQRSERVTDFLTELLQQAHPDNAVGHQVTVEQALDRAADKIAAGDLASEPEVEVAVRTSLAWAYDGLGATTKVRPLLEGALALRPKVGPTDAGANAAMFLADRLRGSEDVRAMALVDQAAADLELLHTPPHETLAQLGHVRGRVHASAGRYREAEQAFRDALAQAEAVGEEDPTATWNQLAHVLLTVGRAKEADELYAKAMAFDRALYGDDHPQVATDWVNVGRAAVGAGRFEEGLTAIDRGLDMRIRLLGHDHRRTISARLERVDALLEAGRTEDAAAELTEAERGYERDTGHPPRGASWDTLHAEVALARGDTDEALSRADAAL